MRIEWIEERSDLWAGFSASAIRTSKSRTMTPTAHTPTAKPSRISHSRRFHISDRRRLAVEKYMNRRKRGTRVDVKKKASKRRTSIGRASAANVCNVDVIRGRAADGTEADMGERKYVAESPKQRQGRGLKLSALHNCCYSSPCKVLLSVRVVTPQPPRPGNEVRPWAKLPTWGFGSLR
jgi:hypothetical protein